MSDSRKLDFLKGLLIGGLIGAAVGVLFAPKSGKETREDISRKTQELMAKAKDEYEMAVEKTKKVYEAAVEKMDEGKGRFKKAIDAGVEAYKEEKEKA